MIAQFVVTLSDTGGLDPDGVMAVLETVDTETLHAAVGRLLPPSTAEFVDIDVLVQQGDARKRGNR